MAELNYTIMADLNHADINIEAKTGNYLTSSK